MNFKIAKKAICLFLIFIKMIVCIIGYNINERKISISPTDYLHENIIETTSLTSKEIEEDEQIQKVEEKEENKENTNIFLAQIVQNNFSENKEPTTNVSSNNEPIKPLIINNNRIEVGGTSKQLVYDKNADHFYLNHNIYGEYDGIGVPFVDFRYDFTGRKTIIYAHSSPNGNGPFQVLQNYHNNPSFYQNNRYITVYYQDNIYKYEIFAIFIITADNEADEGLEYYYRNNYTASEWEETLLRYKSLSDYDTKVSVSSNDKILILQTCTMDPSYYGKYYRANQLVIGKLIP